MHTQLFSAPSVVYGSGAHRGLTALADLGSRIQPDPPSRSLATSAESNAITPSPQARRVSLPTTAKARAAARRSPREQAWYTPRNTARAAVRFLAGMHHQAVGQVFNSCTVVCSDSIYAHSSRDGMSSVVAQLSAQTSPHAPKRVSIQQKVLQCSPCPFAVQPNAKLHRARVCVSVCVSVCVRMCVCVCMYVCVWGGRGGRRRYVPYIVWRCPVVSGLVCLQVHGGMPQLFSQGKVAELNASRPPLDQLVLSGPSPGLLKHHCCFSSCPFFLVDMRSEKVACHGGSTRLWRATGRLGKVC